MHESWAGFIDFFSLLSGFQGAGADNRAVLPGLSARLFLKVHGRGRQWCHVLQAVSSLSLGHQGHSRAHALLCLWDITCTSLARCLLTDFFHDTSYLTFSLSLLPSLARDKD